MDEGEFEARVQALGDLSTALEDYGPKGWARVGEHQIDRLLTRLTDLYWDSAEEQKLTLRARVDGANTWALVLYVGRLSKLVTKETAIECLRRGLAIAALEGCRFDSRDLIVSLVILRHAVEGVGVDSRPAFEEALEAFPGEVTGVFRNARDHSPESMRSTVDSFGPGPFD